MSALTFTLATALALTVVSPAPAQVDSTRRPDSTRADTIKPSRKPADLGPLRTIEFDTDEGTWMNLDVSPDGRTIVFDLLGDIYTLATDGGEAKPLTTGRAWDRWPRFSPDGKSIAFSSDRDGNENLWIMRASGDSARQVTKEAIAAVQQPVWAPDGKYLMVRKNVATIRTYYNAELWLVDEGLEMSLPAGSGYATRYYMTDSFAMTAGVGMPVDSDLITHALESAPLLRRKSPARCGRHPHWPSGWACSWRLCHTAGCCWPCRCSRSGRFRR